jgi:hypothetical protein
MHLDEVKINDRVSFTHKGKKITGKVIHRHDGNANPQLSGHVNVKPDDESAQIKTLHVSTLTPVLKIKEDTEMKNNSVSLYDFIENIEAGDMIAANSMFNELLNIKIDELLDIKKLEVANEMFNTEHCEECDDDYITEEEFNMLSPEEQDEYEELEEANAENKAKKNAYLTKLGKSAGVKSARYDINKNYSGNSAGDRAMKAYVAGVATKTSAKDNLRHGRLLAKMNKEEVELFDEGNAENKAKKNAHMDSVGNAVISKFKKMGYDDKPRNPRKLARIARDLNYTPTKEHVEHEELEEGNAENKAKKNAFVATQGKNRSAGRENMKSSSPYPNSKTWSGHSWLPADSLARTNKMKERKGDKAMAAYKKKMSEDYLDEMGPDARRNQAKKNDYADSIGREFHKNVEKTQSPVASKNRNFRRAGRKNMPSNKGRDGGDLLSIKNKAKTDLRWKKRMAAMNKEHVEQIQELSRKTLGSYVKAATDKAQDAVSNASYHATKYQQAGGAGTLRNGPSLEAQKQAKASRYFGKIANKRNKGINTAVDKLTKEEVDSDTSLKGNQHKIDMNKNGKLDKMDFKMLRKKKNIKEEESDYERDYRAGGATRGEYKQATRNFQARQKNMYGKPKAPEVKASHSVHIDGKKWKSFSSHAHASNIVKKLAAKGGTKKFTVEKD